MIITKRQIFVYYALFSVLVCAGLLCGYFIFSDNLNMSVSIQISANFNFLFTDFCNLIKIILFQFIFGFSIISTPVCFIILLNQSLIYGYSIFFIMNSLNRTDLAIFYIVIYLGILAVYIFASVKAVLYSKTLVSAVPDFKEIIKLSNTHIYIKNYIVLSGILLLLQVIKFGYMILFY
jgi:hypothetical protein